MKCVVILVLLAAVAAKGEQKENSPKLEVYEQCVDKVGISNEQILELRRGQRSEAREPKEYVHCIFEHSRFFSQETGFDVDRMVRGLTGLNVEEAVGRGLITKCVDSNEEKMPTVERTYRTVMCLFENNLNEVLARTGKKKDE